MSSLLPDFEYDIFISYRHNDNRSGWVEEFVKALQDELAATVKDPVSIYFDTNPHDGLHDHHEVDESLRRKLKALILIPIVSRTYCDTSSFAWNQEFKVFIEQASQDSIGSKVNVAGGNVANRVLPIRIHELKPEDVNLFESEMGGKMRAIDFIYKESGVNRPLLLTDNRNDNQAKIDYRNQINKVANAIDEVITGIKAKNENGNPATTITEEIKSKPFNKELKRRNVIRASLVYILFALLLWKVTNISEDILNLTESTIRLITLVLVILFPISILMAWLYERSPQGFIRTGSVESLKNPFSDEQKKPLTSNTFIVLLAVTIAALFLLFPNTASNRSMGNDELDKSIAVLPFANLSNDPDQQFFADGVMEDILTQLQRMGELKVTSKTSVEQYRSTTKRVTDIGDELDVSYLLEGSVRKSGDQVMITAQLIRAGDDSHLWADNFTSEYTTKGLFEIQRQIAENIVHELSLKISPIKVKEITKAQTNNKEAYEHFVKGRQFYSQFSKSSNEIAIEQMRLAIKKDPNYAEAYGGLANALVQRNFAYGYPESWLDSADVYAKIGLKLDDQCAICYKALGLKAGKYGSSNHEAIGYYEKAISINPNYDFALSNSLRIYCDLGKYNKALEVVNRLIQINSTESLYILGSLNANLGNYETARKYFKKELEFNKYFWNLQPYSRILFELKDDIAYQKACVDLFEVSKDSSWLHKGKMEALYMTGKFKEAINYYEKNINLPIEKNPRLIYSGVTYSYFKTGQKEKGTAICDAWINNILGLFNGDSTIVNNNKWMATLAMLNSLKGEKEVGINWLEKAIEGGYMHDFSKDQFYENLYEHPRYKELVVRQKKIKEKVMIQVSKFNLPEP